MTKPTLLKIVQDLLSATSGETVNSIFDTVESEQMARIVGDCYEVMLVNLDFPERDGLFELDATPDIAKPVLMSMPSVAQTIKWIKYDCRTTNDTYPVITEMKYLPLEDFIDRMYKLDRASPHVASFTTTINGASIEVWYTTDRGPEYYTSYDDDTILFNSIDLLIDATLQKTKTVCFGKLTSNFTLSDSFVPAFDENMIPLLKQDAKTQAFSELKQMENNISAKKARDLKIKTQINKDNVKPRNQYVGYGRRHVK